MRGRWTPETVAQRFEEAARTARQLPPVRVQGYYNLWPAIKHLPWETYAAEDKHVHFPPAPAAIDRMLETMRWVLWLSEPQRHLVWRRAEHHSWRAICRQFHCDRTTVWRRWQQALAEVAARLNGCADASGGLGEVSAARGGLRAHAGV